MKLTKRGYAVIVVLALLGGFLVGGPVIGDRCWYAQSGVMGHC